jgi:Transglycosylase SLT domain
LRPVARLGAPAALVAAGLTLGAAQGPGFSAPRTVADEQAVAPAGPVMPFDATPLTVPLTAPIVTDPMVVRPAATPAAASAPLVTIPTALHVTVSAIPRRVLASYVNATKLADAANPQCKLRWQLLAGIGFIESDHARSGGSANPAWDGVADPPIYGPVLDGRNGSARIPADTGVAGDAANGWARAEGPMQFLPSTWAVYAADGNHDGIRNPQDIDDATLAAADYLCATGPALNVPKHLIRAVYAYNHSYSYVRAVLTVAAHYLRINPAKLGINGLPGSPRHRFGFDVLPPTPPKPATHRPAGSTGSPSASPSGSPTPSPTASGSPSPPPSPAPVRSPSPLPSWTPSPTPTGTPSLPGLPGR